ncbi:recombinase family protein [Paenibacillus agaridevorans]|uniref:Recombinase family protein n=2 Tax=Paenibacillus agaridevorans TaxID=171404 RepID=A0A2R5ET92_9BACL|nr:recombinase family protein [Paenibacillus agaridevorans]
MKMSYKLLPTGEYCAYLRKSRSDLEAEERGEEETYARHEKILLELSQRHKITISKIYKEKPISGERISERPEMIQLISDVEDKNWAGVLVVEVERLARGDTMDQGIVAQAFKYSHTFIVTPMRMYDPNDPNDEEYFEFGLFMSRREFKTITRRLQSGRSDAVKDGKYLGNVAPYGYERVKLHGKGYTLTPHPEQSPIVQTIFSMYTDSDPDHRKGSALIAKHLNDHKIPTQKNSKWIVATVIGILRNPVYIGKVRWKSRPLVKRRDGKSRPRLPREDWIEATGLHPAIISEDIFNKAQDIMGNSNHRSAPAGKISNPLAGLIRCGMCGGPIVLRPQPKVPNGLICPAQGCKNVGSYLYLVEEKLIQALKHWLAAYKADWEKNRPNHEKLILLKAQEDTHQSLEKKRKEYEGQKSNLYDLLERKIYTTDVFLQRSQVLDTRIKEINEAILKAEAAVTIEKSRHEARIKTIPQVEHVLAVYSETEDPAHKNRLLSTVLEKIIYTKHKGGRWSGAVDKFELLLFPNIDSVPGT